MNAPVPSALDRSTVASINQRCAEALQAVIATGAVLAVKQPWRITRAVYGWQAIQTWPPEPGVMATDVLAECARLIAREDGRGAVGHWTYDVNHHIALRQAEAALLTIIMGEEG